MTPEERGKAGWTDERKELQRLRMLDLRKKRFELKAEEPKVITAEEEPKSEELKVIKAEEEPKSEEPKVIKAEEEPKIEAPKAEIEDPKIEDPKTEKKISLLYLIPIIFIAIIFGIIYIITGKNKDNEETPNHEMDGYL